MNWYFVINRENLTRAQVINFVASRVPPGTLVVTRGASVRLSLDGKAALIKITRENKPSITHARLLFSGSKEETQAYIEENTATWDGPRHPCDEQSQTGRRFAGLASKKAVKIAAGAAAAAGALWYFLG